MNIARKYRNFSLFQKIYNFAPRFVHTFIYSLYGFLKYKEYKYVTKNFQKSLCADEQSSVVLWQEMQLKKLRNLLIHAQNHCLYYRRLFNEIGFDPNKLTCLEDFKKIPVLTKEDIIENYADLMASNYKSYDPISMSTGGTTGTTLNFLMDKECHFTKEAEIAAYWQRHGYQHGKDKAVMYRAGVLIPPGAKLDKPWRMDYGRKLLYLSSYYSSDDFFKQYYVLLSKYGAEYIHFLPSAAYLFAKYLNENGLKLQFKKAFSASEMLFDFQKIEIEKAFCCEVIEHYGHSEPGNYAAGQCQHKVYHTNPRNVLSEVNEEGLLIETSLCNFSMPFIRYQVGDLVDGIHDNCDCGLNTPYFKKIIGRSSSIVYASNGRKISTIGFDQIFRGNNIKLGQIIQHAINSFEVKLVPSPGFTSANEKSVISKLQDRVGTEATVKISFVENIPLSKSGKYSLIVSKILGESDVGRN